MNEGEQMTEDLQGINVHISSNCHEPQYLLNVSLCR